MMRFSDTPLRLKLLGSFGIILAVLILLTSTAYSTTVANQQAADLVSHTLRVISTANELQANLADMETGYRGFLLAGQDAYLEPYQTSRGAIDEQLDSLDKLTADNPDQLARWQTIRRLVEEWNQIAGPGIALRRDVTAGRAPFDDLIAYVSTGEARRRVAAMRSTARDATASEERLLGLRQAEAAEAAERLQAVLVVGTLIAAGLALLMATLLARDLIGPVGRLAASAGRIASGDLRERVRIARRDEVGVAATAFDRMADRLQEIITRNETILATAAEGILGLDKDGRVTFANPAAILLAGGRADELLGHRIAERIESATDDADGDARAAGDPMGIDRVLTRGTIERGAGNLVRSAGADAARVPIEFTCVPIREGMAVVGAVLTLRDVTERREAEHALESRARELARSNADLEQFAYVASHDLQEPLRAVVSYLQLLERRYREQLDDRADRYIGHAIDGARRMQALINDLLTYSRVGRRGEPVREIDVDALLERVLSGLGVAIEESGAVVTHDPLPTITADPTQFGQLLQNLIGNGIKFHGEAPPRVHISAKRLERAWQFSVRDNGIGIAPEYRDRVFVLFQRLHGRDEYAGTGIGLTVCKKIVERHGGMLWVEDAPGGGSTFAFTIPDAGDQPR